MDHFSRLGLTIAFEQDEAEIAKAHRALQRRVHPDRYVHKSDRERRFAMEHATALNDATRALRDPMKRADYLLLLRGFDVSAEGAARVRLSNTFLMEVLEIREALEELDGSDAMVERARLGREVARQHHDTLTRLGAGLDGEEPVEGLGQMAAQLRYLRRILDEIEAGTPA